MNRRKITVAIASIPNTGKSTLFNALTGSHQAVGNWPGVSVEKKTGEFTLNGYSVTLVDLPGTYSLNATSIEEKVVRDFLINTPPDFIINIADARNLYRSLGLTLQLGQIGIPMIVAVNMMDEARRLGMKLDIPALSEHLGVPVVPIVARTGEGLDDLKDKLKHVIEHPEEVRPPNISCPVAVEDAIVSLSRKLENIRHDPRLSEVFLAGRLLENSDYLKNLKSSEPQLDDITQEAQAIRSHLEKSLRQDLTTVCARCRFNAARGLVRETTSAPTNGQDELTVKIDNWMMHKYLGLPLFLLIMLLLFQGIYALGTPLQNLIAEGFTWLQGALNSWAVAQHWPPLLTSFLVDGLIQGVGVVVAFFPLIALFFIFMSLVEDSGYMARAAFLLDRVMHALGLDGKAFINILLGYGCNVPAVMGTRILSSQHNRIITMLLIPFTLCSARLQVFVFLAGILFTAAIAPWIVFSLYVLSFAMVILVGLFLKLIHFAGKPEPFIMEIPPYRLPTLNTVALRAWQEMKDFLNRASTLIVLGVIFVWILTHLPPGVNPASASTWAGQIGQAVQPVFRPLGIDWQEVIALIFGFVAKEIVIGAMAVIYAGNPAAHIAASVTPLQGLSFMLFTLLYTPCVATVSAIRAESHSWKITAFSIALGLSLAWMVSFLFYQGAGLFGFQ